MDKIIKKPWLGAYGDAKESLEYFDGSISKMVEHAASLYPKLYAYEFMGKKVKYKTFAEEIGKAAKALIYLGVKQNDRVTIAMPNSPQGIIMFYAINKIGAVANMIHPLSSEKEIEFYLNFSKSTALLILDSFYGKIQNIRQNLKYLKYTIVASVRDGLPNWKKPLYDLTLGRKIKPIGKDEPIIYWNEFYNNHKWIKGYSWPNINSDEICAILYSGGTTGTNKGILLTNLNFNALSSQILEMNKSFVPGDVFLAVMPIFHGFGLGIAIHTMLSQGGLCALVPRFTAKSYSKLIKSSHPNYIAGVPSLFEAMMRTKYLQKANLSSLKGVYSGGDSLSIELKKRFDEFLHKHGCKINVREGYGTTECVTASCLTPVVKEKEGSIGVPLPDMVYKICKPETTDEVPYLEHGEICLAGPTVMKGYLDNEKETNDTLKIHDDGLTYVHTGDIGYMDEEGFVYFVQRLKRMIISNGYNIYPSQIENIIDSHESVQMSCVIGVKDPVKMQKVKAYVMLKNGYEKSEKTKQEILEYLKKHVAKYALPYDIEFKDEFPKTLVGKIAYRELEKEANEEL